MLIKLRYRHSRRYACHINIYKTLTNQQRTFVICLHNISLSIPYSLCDVSPEIALINWLIFKSDGDSLSMSTISLLLIFYSSLLNRTQSVSCILKASCHEILPPTSVLSNKVVMKHINKLVSHGKPIFNIIDIYETRLHTIWWYFVKQRIKLNL